MPDPTKDKIVEQLTDQCRFVMRGNYIEYNRGVIRDALDDLRIPDLLTLLEERGCKVDFTSYAASRARILTVVLPTGEES